MGDLVDKTISHYKVLEKLNEGGMGVLYLAEDLELNRKAVLKFLPPDMMNDPDINLRFKREAQAAGSLSHPNIVTIYDVGVHENKTFIAMEYVQGKTLRDVIKSDELTIERITDISVQICEGLNEAHSKGITHRDIKPENILIDEKGKVKIVDFGLAKINNISKEITKAGSTVGTLKYMSPEQIRNQKVDHRSDIWSFGVILYEMITGRYPFQGEHDASIFYSIINQAPEPLARYKADFSDGFQRIIDKALDKEPETRYQHIDELLSDLRREGRVSESPGNKIKKGRKLRKRISYIAATLLIIVLTFITTNYFIKSSSKKVKPPKHTQLTFSGNIQTISYVYNAAEISPDGQFTAYVVNKGNEQIIYVKENFGDQSFEIFKAKNISCLRWSPDGNEIYFSAAVLDSDNSILRINKFYSNFIVPKFGGKVNQIDDPWWFACWAPDGNSFAFIFPSNNDSIRIIDRKTQNQIRTFSLRGKINDLDWSLERNRIACVTINDKAKKYILWTIKADGSQQQKIVENDKGIFSPRWSSDGNYIYYLQDRKETRDLLKVKISSSDETSDNEPIIISTGLQAYGFSITRDNKKLVYTKYVSYSNLWKLTLEKEKKSFESEKLTNGTTSIDYPVISPDNKKITFIKQGNVFIKSIDGDDTKQLTSFDTECRSPSWSPDGKEIAFLSGSEIIIIDASAGIVQKKLKNIDFGDQLYWGSDSIIFYSKYRDYNFYIHNLKTDEKRTFLKNDKNMGWIMQPRLSPDKTKVAVLWNRWIPDPGLWVISIDDSVQNYLLFRIVAPLEWSEDGKWIYAINLDVSPGEILKVSPDNGFIKERIKLPFDNIWEADITPDGKTLVCAVSETNSDVWMIENFDPDVE